MEAELLAAGRIQLMEIRRSNTVDAFPHKNSSLENDSLPYREPVKTAQNWRDVVTASNPERRRAAVV